jgi:hypothetical protein
MICQAQGLLLPLEGIISGGGKENTMTNRTSPSFHEHAHQLRREYLRGAAEAVQVEWTTLIHKIAGIVSSGRLQWHAHARKLHLD